MDRIYHVASAADWEAAQRTGEYRASTRQAALQEIGFIHCSFRDQVERIANAVYADTTQPPLVLVVDPTRVAAEIRVENLGGGEELFPHVYGPLPVHAVSEVLEVRRAGGGWRVTWS